MRQPALHHLPPSLRRRSQPPGALLRALALAGKVAGAGTLALGTAGVAALVVAGRKHDVDGWSSLRSLPRTVRALWWGVGSSIRYKSLARAHAGQLEGEAYARALAAAHLTESQRLLLLCQSNGGIYIKAGQVPGSLQRLSSMLLLAAAAAAAACCRCCCSVFSRPPCAAARTGNLHWAPPRCSWPRPWGGCPRSTRTR